MYDAMVPAGPQGLTADPFSFPTYTIKRPFFSFFERTFRVYSPDGHLIMFVRHPMLKLREQWSIYADEGERVPLLTVKARQIVAINYSHEIFDARSGQHIGTIQKRGLRSILRDTFEIFTPDNRQIGKLEEKGHSLLRRFMPILTSKHAIEVDGAEVTRIRQVFRWFTKEFIVDLSMAQGRIDPRFALACALLALIAEARREDRN
jgi:uncharacterized protein YxjI